jgi:hypothetical protein
LHEYKYEIGYYKWLYNTDKFILEKENEYFRILSSSILHNFPPPLPAGSSKCHTSQTHFLADFIALNFGWNKAACLAT